jgi:hypothetical protein
MSAASNVSAVMSFQTARGGRKPWLYTVTFDGVELWGRYHRS